MGGTHHFTGNSVTLLDASTGKLRTTIQHPDLSRVMFVDAGETLATFGDLAGDDQLFQSVELKLWDTATGNAKCQLDHIGPITLYSKRPIANGRLLAALTEAVPPRFVVWDVNTGKELAAFRHNALYQLSPDGKTAIASSPHGPPSHELWDVATNKLRVAVPGRYGTGSFSPDSRTLFTVSSATSGEPELLKWWETDTGKERASGTHPGFMRHFYMPDGKTLITVSPARLNQPGLLKLWNATTGKQRASLEHDAAWPCADYMNFGTRLDFIYVRGILFSPKCDTVGVASEPSSGGEVNLWDVATGELRAAFKHPSPVLAVAITRDGTTLAVAGGGHDHSGLLKQRGDLWLWDLKTRKRRALLTDHGVPIRCVAFSPDGKTLISNVARTFGSDRLRLWDVATGREVGTLECEGVFNGVAFHPDGAILATASGGPGCEVVILWNVPTRTKLASLPRAWPQSPVAAIAFTADGKTLAARSVSGALQLWDVQTQEVQTMPRKPYSGSRSPCLAFTPDCKTVVEMEWDVRTNGTARNTRIQCLVVRDVATGEHKMTFDTGQSRNITSAAFSPDGKTLVFGTTVRRYRREFSQLKLWDLGTGAERFAWKLPFGPLTYAEFTRDGKTLVVGGTTARTTKLQLWDAATGEERFALTDVDSFAAFSPNGKILVTGSLDAPNTATLREAATGRVLATLPGTAPEFSPDSKTLALIRASEVRLWDVIAIRESLANPEDP